MSSEQLLAEAQRAEGWSLPPASLALLTVMASWPSWVGWGLRKSASVLLSVPLVGSAPKGPMAVPAYVDLYGW